MGFLDSLAKSAALWGAVQASKDENGKPDPYKAAGIAAGMGNFSLGDRARLGAMLGSQGAFDSTNDYSCSCGDDGAGDGWKLYCEDGFDYDVDPDDYDSEEEYMEALTEAKYAWRDECEDGSEHGIDAEDYETVEEYEEALNEAKNGWHDECEDGFEYDVDPEDYENEEEYNDAIELAKSKAVVSVGTDIETGTDILTERVEVQVSDSISVPITLQISVPKHDASSVPVNSYATRREQYVWRKHYRTQENYGLNIYAYETENEFLQALAVAREDFFYVAKQDKTIYYYCAVVYEDNPYPYHYRIEDTTLKIGDKVVVPVGNQNTERIAEIVSFEQHSRLTVPYPVEKTKFVIRKYEK